MYKGKQAGESRSGGTKKEQNYFGQEAANDGSQKRVEEAVDKGAAGAPRGNSGRGSSGASGSAASRRGGGERNTSLYVKEEDSETDSEDSDLSGTDEEDTSWISWFCGLKGNEFFCEVEEEYIQDDFNLSGLSSQVPYYDYALDLILDVESPNDDILTEEQHEMVESAAEMLYGLIHVRYILTSGMSTMLEKCKNVDFGRCPRVHCSGQPCLPVGQSDIPRTSTVKIYCPKCEDIYYPRSRYQGNIDGAYFGTTFPHLFLMTYPYMVPPKPTQSYIPRIFGFKIHGKVKQQRLLQQQLQQLEAQKAAEQPPASAEKQKPKEEGQKEGAAQA
eukprot:jgi/Mesvir1/6518/Mv16783-RA.1